MEKNEVAKEPKSSFFPTVAKVQEQYVTMIEKAANEIGLDYDSYQKTCAFNCISYMQELLIKQGLTFNEVDTTNVTKILQRFAMLRLNAAAYPRECYIILRDETIKVRDQETGQLKDKKVKMFDAGIEGDGNDKLLRKNGIDIKKVYPIWKIREKDDFTYPSYKGIEMVPPTWTPHDFTSKIIRIVYPIQKEDGDIEYYISEREDVKNNLLAHINQNLMKEYFGTSTYGLTDRKEIKRINMEVSQKRAAIINEVKDKTLEEILDDESVQQYMSPAWRSAHSRESMIVRKMRNNATKPIPKDFENSMIAIEYENSINDLEEPEHRPDPRIKKENAVDAEVTIEAVSEPIDIDLPAHDQTPKNNPNNAQDMVHEATAAKKNLEESSEQEQVEQPKTSKRVKPY